MLKKKDRIILGISIILMAIIFFILPELGLFSVSGNSMQRTIPEEVEAGESFTLIYEINSQDSKWGVSLIDAISGSCTFSNGQKEYRDVILSSESERKEITVETSNEEGICTFSGDYKFGDENINNFQDQTVQIIKTPVDDGGDEDNETNGDENDTIQECETSDDCPTDSCFGYECMNGECVELEGLPSPPEECLNNATWNDYPDCKWNCPGEKIEEEWWNQEVFPVGDFSVKAWMVGSLFGFLILLKLIGGKK